MRRTPSAAFGLFYPALFGAFAVLTLFASNLEELRAADLPRPLLTALALGAAVCVLCRLIWRDSRGGLVASASLVVFFSYGHLLSALGSLQISGVNLGHHRYALTLGVLAWVGCVAWATRRQRPAAARALQAAALVVVAVSATGLLWRAQQASRPLDPTASTIRLTEPMRAGEAAPDIYYLVLDGYGRQDILARYYGYDNSPFLDRLRALGFYVADRSTANYNQTVLSLAASLNMQYVQDLVGGQPVGFEGRARLAERLKQSQVRSYLAALGYELVAFETGYSQTEIRDADVLWGPGSDPNRAEHPLLGGQVSPFESLLISTTALRAAIDFDPLRQQLALSAVVDPHYAAHRARVRYTLSSLGRAAERPGPTFVFAHVISPHPPFVFDARGGPVPNEGIYSLADADAFGGSPSEYIARYRDQLEYLNVLVIQALEQILRRSERPAVILLQADHGPGAYLVWDSADQSVLEERFGILNAYYFFDRRYETLDPAISPVNSFRVVLSAYLDAQLERVPDRSYFSSWDAPLDLAEVTRDLQGTTQVR
jgi:hypothetical protein